VAWNAAVGCLGFLSRRLSCWEGLEAVGVDSLESNLQEARLLFDRLASELFGNTGETTRTRTYQLATYLPWMKAAADRTCWSLQTCRADVSRALGAERHKPVRFHHHGKCAQRLFAGDDQRVEKRRRRISSLIQDWLAAARIFDSLDPALKETSRDLLRVRTLLDMLPLTVYSPAFIANPAPLLHLAALRIVPRIMPGRLPMDSSDRRADWTS